MPTYEHECAHCGLMELERRMSDPSPTSCPTCGAPGLVRIYQAHFHGACDANQESENNGLGKWYPQLGARFLDPHTKTKPNPNAYARSRTDAIEKFKKRGYTDIEKC